MVRWIINAPRYYLMYYTFLGLQLGGAVLYVGYLLHRYCMQEVSVFVRALVYLTWLLSFSIVVLLPFDIYNSLHMDYAMAIAWKIIYYGIFILTWLLLPIAQEYETAGEFTVRAKLKTAVINNLIIYGIFAGIGAAFFVYLAIKGKLDLEALMPILLAASNAFGLFLVVIFLSYGLVALPKNLWMSKQYGIKLKHEQFNAAKIHRRKETVLQEL